MIYDFKKLVSRASDANVSVAQICRDADISYSTVVRWIRGDTNPTRKIERVEQALRKYEQADNE
tara:strand:+ start:2499 stop:2690 length:192 start_codon:yes stop_codon:yes gene_type:complete